MNWTNFFSMGGYGLYVWGSYAVAAAILLFNVVTPLRRHKIVLQQLREFYRLREKAK